MEPNLSMAHFPMPKWRLGLAWRDDDYEPNQSSQWHEIPADVLAQIMSFLPLKSAMRAAETCTQWFDIIVNRSEPWETFLYRDYIYTRRRYTTHAGWQRSIDHWKLRLLIQNASPKWRQIVVKPVTLLSNLYEFMRVLTNFTEYYEANAQRPLQAIRSFEFDWQLFLPAESHNARSSTSSSNEIEIQTYGTGGQVLRKINELLSHLFGLRFLALRQLQLDQNEAVNFMNDVVEYFSERLHSLTVLNLTKLPTPFLHLGLFLHLRKLTVSPQHLNEDVIFLLANCAYLHTILILQDENTNGAMACNEQAWQQLHKLAPMVQVHLRIRGWRCTSSLCLQPGANVTSIIFDTPHHTLRVGLALNIIDLYRDSLRVFVQCGLQRRYTSKAYHERADLAVLMLARNCSNLCHMAIRERLSCATVLAAAQLIANRRSRNQLGSQFAPPSSDRNETSKLYLSVRRNALLKRADYHICEADGWSKKHQSWMKHQSRDFDRFEISMQQVLGQKDWKAMSDNQYWHYYPKFIRRTQFWGSYGQSWDTWVLH